MNLFGGYWVEPFVINILSNGSETLHIKSDYREYLRGTQQELTDEQLETKVQIIAKQRRNFLALPPEEQEEARVGLEGMKYSQWFEEERNARVAKKIIDANRS